MSDCIGIKIKRMFFRLWKIVRDQKFKVLFLFFFHFIKTDWEIRNYHTHFDTFLDTV